MKKLTILIFAFIFILNNAYSDQFTFKSVYCEKKEFNSEIKICNDKKLLNLMEKIDVLYKVILKKNNDFRKVLIVDTRYSYLREIANCANEEENRQSKCILSKMNKRLELLKKVKRNNRDIFNYLNHINYLNHELFWKYGHFMVDKKIDIIGTVLYEKIGSDKGFLVSENKTYFPEIPVKLENPISKIEYNRHRYFTWWSGFIRQANNELFFELNDKNFP